MNIFKRLYNYIRYHGMYIIADASDNSITMSKRLVRHMVKHNGQIHHLLDVKLSTSDYAIIVNPDVPEEVDGTKTALSQMQVNDRHHSVGFYAYNLQYMFMDYSLPLDAPVRMQVVPSGFGQIKFYKICH